MHVIIKINAELNDPKFEQQQAPPQILQIPNPHNTSVSQPQQQKTHNTYRYMHCISPKNTIYFPPIVQ